MPMYFEDDEALTAPALRAWLAYGAKSVTVAALIWMGWLVSNALRVGGATLYVVADVMDPGRGRTESEVDHGNG